MKKIFILFVCMLSVIQIVNAQNAGKNGKGGKGARGGGKGANTTAPAKTNTDSLLNAKKLAEGKRISDSITNTKKDSLINAQTRAKKWEDSSLIKFDIVQPSMRSENSVDVSISREKIPFSYNYIREDDAIFREKIWRIIDTHEKINMPFNYSTEEDNGKQTFLDIILNAVNPKYPRKPGQQPIMAFSDDRFSIPKSFSEISLSMVGAPTVADVPDLVKDPNREQNPPAMKKDTLSNPLNYSDFTKFEIEEEVVFDKKTSRLYTRILGIAPLKNKAIAVGRDTLYDTDPMFWIYYPDIRTILVNYKAYNPKNSAARRTWEQVFEDRYFSSYTVKTTMDNPQNKKLLEIVKNNPLFMLLEGEKIKEKIFNYEQDLWAY